jgi:hypothetical protein
MGIPSVGGRWNSGDRRGGRSDLGRSGQHSGAGQEAGLPPFGQQTSPSLETKPINPGSGGQGGPPASPTEDVVMRIDLKVPKDKVKDLILSPPDLRTWSSLPDFAEVLDYRVFRDGALDHPGS